MWETARAKQRDWYIVVIAVLVIGGGLFVASHQSSSTEPAAAVHSANPSPAPETAAQPPQHQHQTAVAAPAATSTAGPNPPSSAPAAPPKALQPPAHPSSSDEHAAMHAMAAAEPQAHAQASSGSVATTPAGGDAGAGRLVFRKCQACHPMEPGKTLLGPSLAGIIGRKAGADTNYNYSPAMKQANVVWDAKSLDAYLADPQKVVPGNKMPFPGLKTEQDRADVIAFFAGAGGGAQTAAAAPPGNAPAPAREAPPATNQATPQAPANQAQGAPSAGVTYVPDANYTLRSGIAEGRMVYIGVGGAIDGKVNPILTASEGQVVQLTLINGEGAEHDIVFPDQNAKSPRVTGKGASTTIAFRATKAGDFIYFCSVPGHQLAGMQGQFIVTTRPAPETLVEADISREPTDLPPPVGKREPQTVRVDLVSVEVEGRLAEGTTFGYWTFNGKVAGPFIRHSGDRERLAPSTTVSESAAFLRTSVCRRLFTASLVCHNRAGSYGQPYGQISAAKDSRDANNRAALCRERREKDAGLPC